MQAIEKKLAEPLTQNAVIEEVFAASEEAILIVGPLSTIRRCNDRARHLLGIAEPTGDYIRILDFVPRAEDRQRIGHFKQRSDGSEELVGFYKDIPPTWVSLCSTEGDAVTGMMSGRMY